MLMNFTSCILQISILTFFLSTRFRSDIDKYQNVHRKIPVWLWLWHGAGLGLHTTFPRHIGFHQVRHHEQKRQPIIRIYQQVSQAHNHWSIDLCGQGILVPHDLIKKNCSWHHLPGIICQLWSAWFHISRALVHHHLSVQFQERSTWVLQHSAQVESFPLFSAHLQSPLPVCQLRRCWLSLLSKASAGATAGMYIAPSNTLLDICSAPSAPFFPADQVPLWLTTFPSS